MTRRPRFLLFCMYVVCYFGLRGYGEIVGQSARMQGGGMMTQVFIVGSDPSVPRWRRQVYRVVFSPLMVAEEEARRLLAQWREQISLE